jgi:hypothetical protein
LAGEVGVSSLGELEIGSRPAPGRLVSTGTTLGSRYRLESTIGTGGMATVWRALDLRLDRPVAIKRLHAARAADYEFATRFRREAQLVARLSHPNLVRLLDAGEDEDGPYLVLELVEGETLKDRIRREGALDPYEAARLCAQVADGLAYAHAEGIVHRDVKSQNVLIAGDGRARLTDFGIARTEDAEADGLTRTDVMIGSADYLAPEQADGRRVDPRTDVYSLGIVLFEALTGTLPFRGDGFVAVAMQHVSRPLPDPCEMNPGVPAYLAAVARRAAAKDPADRFQSAARLAEALREEGGITQPDMERPIANSGETAVMPAPRRRRRVRALAWMVLAVLVLAAVGVAGVRFGPDLIDADGSGRDAPAVVDLRISAVEDYAPEGSDQSERPEETGAVTDGDPETAWHTERYATADFGNLKSGVGLLVGLAEPAEATELVLDATTAGASFEVLGAEGPDGQRELLGRGTTTGGTQTVPLQVTSPQSAYLIWFTELAPDGAGRYWGDVGQVSLRGPANPDA